MKTLADLQYVLDTVHVALKDKVFQPSNAFHHEKELVDIVRANCSEDGVSANDPIMFLYSDGGPNHWIFKSVKIAAIYIFMALDLDAYIAARTALNQSYHNPAERVMSTLNLGLQNVNTARESMESTK